jgi:hypothetical protein
MATENQLAPIAEGSWCQLAVMIERLHLQSLAGRAQP